MKQSTKHFREKVGRLVTIVKRGRTYHGEFCLNGVQGRRALGTRNLKRARECALEMDAELQRGDRPQKLPRIPIKDAVDSYLAHVESEGRCPKTVTKYRTTFTDIQQFTASQGAVHLDQLSLLLAEKYRASLRKAGYADKTIADRTISLKTLTKWAVERGLLARNPLTGLKGIKAKASPQPCFTLDEVEKILSAARGQQKDILEVLAFSGMRIGELQWLTWDDVDLEASFIRIQPKDGWSPKHKRSRVIPIHDRVRKTLERLPRNHRWVFAAGKSLKYPNGGHQINPRHVLERLKAVLLQLGLKGHLHTFRHFFTSHCANNGVPPFQLIKWLGHADVGMVMHYYDLHDEESLSTMQRLSQAGSKEPAESPVQGQAAAPQPLSGL